MALKKLCVFCGSKPGANPKYQQTATDLGKLMAQKGIKLIYGAGDTGLMGAIAESALEHKGDIEGYTTEIIAKREVPIEGTTIKMYPNIQDRKKAMIENSDAFCVLPGGYGTFDEIFEVMVGLQIGETKKPIVLVNIDGFWDNLEIMINQSHENGFIADKDINHFITVNTHEEALEKLEILLDN